MAAQTRFFSKSRSTLGTTPYARSQQHQRRGFCEAKPSVTLVHRCPDFDGREVLGARFQQPITPCGRFTLRV